jgi:predicted PhzF superfamily epimerase YddE/YHI9
MEYTGPHDRDTQRQSAILQTKAGKVPIFYNPYRQVAACGVPTNFHAHDRRVSMDAVIATQPHIQIVPTIEKVKQQNFPVVSIVKGMTFSLIDLTDAPEVLAALQPAKAPEVELDEAWKPSFVGALYYKRLPPSEAKGEPTIHNIQARMISHGVEDPGTGSACCALSAYLALNLGSNDNKAEGVKGASPDTEGALAAKTKNLDIGEARTERMVFGILQGKEMGRLCTIAIEVDVRTDKDGKRSVANIVLSGRASAHLEGKIIGR